MSYELNIYRIPEHDGSLVPFRIYVDGVQKARIEKIDETITLELESGQHSIQVKMWPYYYRSTPLKVDELFASKNQLLFTGTTGKMNFAACLRNELKLLPENEFKLLIKQTKPWPKLSSLNMFFVLLTSLITGGYMIYVSQSQVLDEDSSFLALILGAGTAIGGFSAYYFNQSKTNSKFAYNKPIFDAITLLMLMLLLDDMFTTEWYVSGALVIAATRFWFYLKLTRK